MMEFGAKLFLKDNMFSVMKKNAEMQREFKERIDQTNMAVKGLGKAKATPTISVNDKATGIAESILNTVETVGAMTATPEMGVKDNATKKVDVILEKIREAKSMVVSPVIRLRDNVTSSVGKIKRRLKEIATTYTPIVRVRDLATKGLSKIKNTLGGLKKVFSPIVKIKDGATKVIKSIHSGLQGLGKMAVKPLVAIKDGATAGLGKIKNILGSLAKGVTVAVTLAGAGATALLGGSIKEGASLEQSIGGVETLFKGDAGKVKANADMAFQTAGLSANAYMETVTSFSASLLQSLGGDTAKASTIADQAIIDMADNANKFGTDMGSIQNAYQGFAKQNYTMLDNLKLGYGGTQEEMQRLLSDASKLSGVKYDISSLSDVYSAIHTVQENLGVAGTTAKEASATFSGSFASMKASAKNLLGNLAVGGDVKGSMVALMDTASTFLFDNALPMVGRIFESLPDVIGIAVEKGVPKIKELGGTMVIALKDGLKSILPSELGSLVDPAFEGIGTAFKGAVGMAKSIAQGIVPVITALAPIVGQLGGMFERVAPVIRDAFSNAFGNSGGILDSFVGVISSALPVVEDINTTVAQTIGAVLPSMFTVIESLGNVFVAVMPIVSNLTSVFGQIIQAVYPVIYNVISMALNSIIPIIQSFSGLIQSAMPIVGGIIQTFHNVVATIFPVVQTIFQGLGDKIAQIVGVVTSHMGLIQGIFETVSPIIQSAVEILAQVFSACWDIVSPIIDLAMTLFNALWGVVEAVFPAIQSTIETVWSVLEPVFGAIANGLSMVGDAISGVADFVGSGIDTVKGWFGFAYGKDRVPYDNYPAVLHQGEKVLTRNQADQYERSVSTRGVQLTKNVQPLERSDGSTTPTGDTRITQDTPQESKGGTQVNIEKLADTVVIEKEADVDKVVEDMVKKFRKLVPNMP